ncbi:hypothetical protein BP00DRAFT_475914 [Aspergillus indologenus CBS 114.80]|uniref:Uncharacterized protein n=1 Tax=Aspergillus indologenus CBS 114.80 TaxID=1450541 RepID=A0A2V5J1P6_9EURO|nr:hypothetical protein BP00DRAFT_475914 [Aspergillus indologenus CBS 114.80]
MDWTENLSYLQFLSSSYARIVGRRNELASDLDNPCGFLTDGSVVYEMLVLLSLPNVRRRLVRGYCAVVGKRGEHVRHTSFSTTSAKRSYLVRGLILPDHRACTRCRKVWGVWRDCVVIDNWNLPSQHRYQQYYANYTYESKKKSVCSLHLQSSKKKTQCIRAKKPEYRRTKRLKTKETSPDAGSTEINETKVGDAVRDGRLRRKSKRKERKKGYDEERRINQRKKPMRWT